MGKLKLKSKHRLLCGDSTSEDDVARLMDGEKIESVVTDPPYGMDAVKNSGVLKEKYRDVAGDDSIDVAVKSFKLIDDNIPQIWWGANYYANELPNQSCWLVRDKNNGGSDQMDCELAWTNLKGVTRQFTQASEKTGRIHPTQKPVKLVCWCIEKMDAKVVLDLFLGSGATLIACEQLNRQCYGLEIDPLHCDVVVKRWENLTGETAHLESVAPTK